MYKQVSYIITIMSSSHIFTEQIHAITVKHIHVTSFETVLTKPQSNTLNARFTTHS